MGKPRDGSAGKLENRSAKVTKRNKAYLLQDTADWSGMELRSFDVGAAGLPNNFKHNGYLYCTEGEWHMACLLTAHGVPFTPDVQFELGLGSVDGSKRLFVPDFVFNGEPWLMFVGQNAVELVHGLEIKGNSRGDWPERAKENTRLLWEQRGINIKLVSNSEAGRLYARWQKRRRNAGSLPLPLLPLDLFGET